MLDGKQTILENGQIYMKGVNENVFTLGSQAQKRERFIPKVQLI